MSGPHRPTVALDWSGHHVHATFDGKAVERLPDVGALLDRLATPHRIVCEATLESYDAGRRAAVLARIDRDGHELVVFNPRQTARARKRWDVTKSDANDARVIFRLAAEGRVHLMAAVEPDPVWTRRRDVANRQYTRIRGSARKDELVVAAEAALGPYHDLDDDARAALGNGKGWMASVVAAAFFAAQWARSRDEFERLLGLHASAYPSLLRSEIHKHGYPHLAKRDVTWAQLRRELRRVYRTFSRARRDAGIPPGGEHLPYPPSQERDDATVLDVLLAALAGDGADGAGLVAQLGLDPSLTAPLDERLQRVRG